jgi:hypothetical protein
MGPLYLGVRATAFKKCYCQSLLLSLYPLDTQAAGTQKARKNGLGLIL